MKIKNNEAICTQMYKNNTDIMDIMSCYFSTINQFKMCSYTGQFNDIDMYSHLSNFEYDTNRIYEN